MEFAAIQHNRRRRDPVLRDQIRLMVSGAAVDVVA